VIDIVYESKELVIADKPSFLPTAPLKNGGGSCFLSEVAKLFPEILTVKGRQPWEGGLLHRLDTPTSGLVMFARNQEAFDALLEEQLEGGIIKTYRCRITSKKDLKEGYPPYPFHDAVRENGIIHSSFRSFGPKGAQVRPLKEERGKVYFTQTQPSGEEVICTIENGFRHQIRCHMAWAGYPLLGDTLYGGEPSDSFGLRAIALSFTLPGRKERIEVRV